MTRNVHHITFVDLRLWLNTIHNAGYKKFTAEEIKINVPFDYGKRKSAGYFLKASWDGWIEKIGQENDKAVWRIIKVPPLPRVKQQYERFGEL